MTGADCRLGRALAEHVTGSWVAPRFAQTASIHRAEGGFQMQRCVASVVGVLLLGVTLATGEESKPTNSGVVGLTAKVLVQDEQAVEGRDYRLEGGRVVRAGADPIVVFSQGVAVERTRVEVLSATNEKGEALPKLIGKKLAVVGSMKAQVKALDGKKVELKGTLGQEDSIDVDSVREVPKAP